MIQHITQEEGLILIEKYIFDLTGHKIKANPPTNIVQLKLFHEMAHFVKQYYENENSSQDRQQPQGDS